MSIPWSERAEKWARRIIILDWVLVWVWIFSFLYCLFAKSLVGSVITVIAAGLFTADLIYTQDKLAEMLSNKPRSTAGLTNWIQLRDWQTEIHCACGARVEIGKARWHPNSVDRGGGRFALVCPCGIGYFKLKAVTSDS
jgi:hypothetical protein